jgi:antitoxin StbD
LADVSAGISELQKNPLAVLEQGHGAPVVILHHDEPAFYAVPAELYEMLLEKLEDIELVELVRRRERQPEIEVDVNDL